MSVVSAIELARTVEEELGGTARAVRRFACVLSDDTLQGNPPTEAEITAACNIGSFGAQHPTMTAYNLRKVVINERFGDSPYHVEVVAEYNEVNAQEILVPTARDAVWSFEATPGQIAALMYYDGTTLRPLVNSANDYLQGLVTEESMVAATIRKNYVSFPYTQINAANSINDGDFLGVGDTHRWKMIGGNITRATEIMLNTTYTFWAAEWKLQGRQSGWVLQIPDVGWNFLIGGEKRRCMVFDERNAEWVASPTPMPLSSGQQQLSGRPDILQRRVNPEANFTALFGTPP